MDRASRDAPTAILLALLLERDPTRDRAQEDRAQETLLQ
jgi:hypothetical protein